MWTSMERAYVRSVWTSRERYIIRVREQEETLKFLVSLAVLTSAVLVTGIVVGAQEYPHAFPRAGIEKIFENDRVIAWDATWPDGVEQPYHRHRYDMTGVFFRWGPLRVTRLDGTFTQNDEPFDIPWVFFQPKGVTHKEEGVGTPERHAVMIDMKDGAFETHDLSTDLPLAFPRPGVVKELERERVTVWDVVWQEGEEPGLHVHPKDTVVVFIAGGGIRTRDLQGATQMRFYEPEDVVFVPAGTMHVSAAETGSPRAMFYELEN